MNATPSSPPQRQPRQRGAKPHSRRHIGDRKNQHKIGPKSFPYARLLAIYTSIASYRIDRTADIEGQISSLVALRLFDKVSNHANLDAIRYRVRVHCVRCDQKSILVYGK